jgi:hypothetical protein
MFTCANLTGISKSRLYRRPAASMAVTVHQAESPRRANVEGSKLGATKRKRPTPLLPESQTKVNGDVQSPGGRPLPCGSVSREISESDNYRRESHNVT